MRSISKDTDYLASATDWENFLKGNIWHDLQLFLADHADALYGDLVATYDERKASNSDAENDDVIRGRIREGNFLILAPEEILRELKEDDEEKDIQEPK